MIIGCSGSSRTPALAEVLGAAARCVEGALAAVRAAAPGEAVLLFAPDYPGPAWQAGAEVWELARTKGLRLYVEYAADVPGMTLGDPRFLSTGIYGSIIDRLIVSSGLLAPELEQLRLLTFYDCHYLPGATGEMHLALGRVVGFNRAELGLPEETQPLLVTHPDQPWLVATTALSRCIEARCAPTAAWQALWRGILAWLGEPLPKLSWQATVRPSHAAETLLPEAARTESLRRACGWIERSRLLVHPTEFEGLMQRYDGRSALSAQREPGDGHCGIMESYSSKRVFVDGKHAVAAANRPDCTAQAAAVAAFGTVLFGDARGREIAANLMDFTFESLALRPGGYADPANGAYGLLPFDTTATELSFSDDNARAILGGILAGTLLADPRWDAAVLRCILANLRTTGRDGYRPNKCATLTELGTRGWLPFWEHEGEDYNPHFHSWIWACFLWLYDKTDYEPLRERARRGVAAMMRAWPEKWGAEGGRLESELSHMLLPLAWLLRVEREADHAETLGWIETIFGEIERLQAPCGALRQWVVDQWTTEIDPAERTILTHPAPRNDCYGVEEGPIIYRNGEPGTDLLYSLNFAILGLSELAAVTNDPRHRQSLERMLDFSVRAQTRSEQHPELDGTWYRGFDFEGWDFWGSDTDWGYGVLTTEVGWGHSLITTALALRELDTNFWDLTAGSSVPEGFAEVLAEMLPGIADEAGKAGAG